METKFQYYRRVVRDASFGKFFKVLDEAHIRSGKKKICLFLDIIKCMIRYKAGYNDYVIFEFWDLNHKQRDTYLTRFRSKKFIEFMNDPAYDKYFDDKVVFNEVFKDYIGREFIDLDISSVEEVADFCSRKTEVFAKMKNLSCGKGCEKLQTADFENVDNFVKYIMDKGFGTIEDVVKNHPDIDKLYPFSVNTMRMITFLDSKGKGHCVFSVFKMGINGRVVDNFGLHGPVDIETGEFLYPAHSGDTTAGVHYTEHPYSHIPLLGYKVPYIRQAVEMVEKAATVIPQVRYVGWDVAITPQGPVIIEGNNYCAHDFWQLPGQTPNGIGIIPTIEKIIPEFKIR